MELGDCFINSESLYLLLQMLVGVMSYHIGLIKEGLGGESWNELGVIGS